MTKMGIINKRGEEEELRLKIHITKINHISKEEESRGRYKNKLAISNRCM